MSRAQIKRYVISLRSRRESGHTPADLLSAIHKLKMVTVIEGEGLRHVTVEMPEETVEAARTKIPFATVSPYRELDLL